MVSNKQRVITLAILGVIGIGAILLSRPGLLSFLVPMVFAHCDTMGGPVIQAAQKALDTGNVNLVLIWVQKNDEAEIKKTFEKTLAVRKLSPQAKELADMYFFETLVRIHRAGEGAPYTGLKPAGEVEPIVALSDKALDTGTPDGLVKEVTGHIAAGIKEKFNRAIEAKKHMTESVGAGREYVAAYVTFVHYVEGIHLAAQNASPPHEDTHGAEENAGHQHKHK